MERHFEQELAELKGRLLWMGSLAERAVHQAVQALLESDERLARRVLEEEPAINAMQMEIDERVMNLLALQQLMARDLRFALAVTRINADLERIGDLAVNISQAAIRLLNQPRIRPYVDLGRMAALAEEMLREGLNAMVRGDVETARAILARDDEVDRLRDQTFQDLLADMMANSSAISPALEFILVSKNLERVADHATNIAEDVIYMVAGSDVRHHAFDLP
jgi:phosphate transport system protein